LPEFDALFSLESWMSALRRTFLFFGFLAFSIGFSGPSALAANGDAAGAVTAEASLATPQGKFIQDLGDKALAILSDKKLSAEQRDQKFRDMLHKTFDLATIGRFVIGRTWLAASQDQQQEYMKLFEQLVVKTYSDRFAFYTGEGFKVRVVRPEGERDVVVSSDITHPDGSPPTVVDWRVREKNGKIGIIDVVVEGVSMSVTQRQEYASVIDRNGGDINGLLNVMRQHLQDQGKPAGRG
jgi:phospholipid transport system substrate-binding protein